MTDLLARPQVAFDDVDADLAGAVPAHRFRLGGHIYSVPDDISDRAATAFAALARSGEDIDDLGVLAKISTLLVDLVLPSERVQLAAVLADSPLGVRRLSDLVIRCVEAVTGRPTVPPPPSPTS